MNVKRKRVGDVLSLRRRAVDVDPGSKYAEIGIRSFGRGIFHKEAVSGADLGAKRVFRIEPGDLVVSNVFAWEGAIAVASEAEAGRVGSHRFMTFVPINDCIDTSWASWYFRSEQGLELIRQASPGSAGRNRTLAIERFEALEIPVPPIDEQRPVAEHLDRVASGVDRLRVVRMRTTQLAVAIPLAMRTYLERDTQLKPAHLGEVLELVKSPLEIDPTANYVSIGIRSFGKGIFHYPRRPGADIGKLRFQYVAPHLLAISNIKAWEGAVAVTEEDDHGAVASNRFLFFRPVAGEDALEYFRLLLLGPGGIAALGQASPGSADRNRTLAVERFQSIELELPDIDEQARIGRILRETRSSIALFESNAKEGENRVNALLPAALNHAFASLG